jgi:hypothetical protein
MNMFYLPIYLYFSTLVVVEVPSQLSHSESLYSFIEEITLSKFSMWIYMFVHLLWFRSLMSTKDSCVESLVPRVALLGDDGTFKRWDTVEGL